MMDVLRRGMAAAAAVTALVAAQPGAAREACALEPEEIFATVGGSVVEIFSIGINPFLVNGRISAMSGAGFLIEGGYVATNYHVVADATDIVIFGDGEPAGATVVGIDPALDLAVLMPEYPVTESPPVTFAAEGSVSVGQRAYAIGFPFQLGKSISSGIVSGTSRVLNRTTTSWLAPFLQTDAAINPGNSGGPLVDECGRVVGMVTSTIGADGVWGLGFATPTRLLVPALEALRTEGKVARPWHGLYGQMMDVPMLLMLGIPQWDWAAAEGFLVETVEPGSAADRAGLRGGTWPVLWGGTEILLGGDIITEVNGRHIDSLDTAIELVRGLEIGETVRIRYLRFGEAFETEVEIEERPLLEAELDVYRTRRR